MNGIEDLNKGEEEQEMEGRGVATMKMVFVGTLALSMQCLPPAHPHRFLGKCVSFPHWPSLPLPQWRVVSAPFPTAGLMLRECWNDVTSAL